MSYKIIYPYKDIYYVHNYLGFKVTKHWAKEVEVRNSSMHVLTWMYTNAKSGHFKFELKGVNE